MLCESELGKSGRKLAALKYYRDNLMYEIKGYCHTEGSVSGREDTHQRHMIEDVGEEGLVDLTTRELDLAVAVVRERLYVYTRREVDEPIRDNKLPEQDMYGIMLELPAGFSQTTLSLIDKLIHRYIVSRCVYNWLSVTYPEKAVVWGERAEAAMSEIDKSLQRRTGRTRRRPHPF